MSEWSIGPGERRTEKELLEAIDRGNFSGGRIGREWHFHDDLLSEFIWYSGMWTLDPIDGTKGFLRGEQYAVCLALIVDAQVELGVIGCPNLPVDPCQPDGAKGCLFVAVRGQGSQQLTLSGANPTPLPIIQPDTLGRSKISFLESVESTHSSHPFTSRVSKLLGMDEHRPIRMDSQAKYCCLARTTGLAYLRMPTGVGYKEKIWVRFC